MYIIAFVLGFIADLFLISLNKPIDSIHLAITSGGWGVAAALAMSGHSISIVIVSMTLAPAIGRIGSQFYNNRLSRKQSKSSGRKQLERYGIK